MSSMTSHWYVVTLGQDGTPGGRVNSEPQDGSGP